MARRILNYGHDFIDMTGDTSCAILGVILGGHLGDHHFLSKRDPQKSDQSYIQTVNQT